MGFASRDAVYAALTAGRKQSWQFFKQAVTAEAAGSWTSYYKAAGSPGAGTDPTTWASFDNGSGSVYFADVSPSKRYLASVSVASDAAGSLLIYDRLGHANVVTTSTGDKTVTATLASRYSTADTDDKQAIQAWVEVTTACTVSAAIIDLESYTNEGGTSAQNGGTVTFPSGSLPTAVAYMDRLPLAAGDKGVTAIDHVDVNTASTAGAVNVVMIRPLAVVPLVANVATVIDLWPSLPRVYDDSSICFALLASSTSGANISGELVCVYDS